MDWCKTAAPGQQLRPRSSFRLAVGSLTEDFRNQIAVVGLQDERVLVEDDYPDNYSDFVTLVEVHHGYPATSLQWQPAGATSYNWSQKAGGSELLASTGDALRVWEYSTDNSSSISSYVGRPTSNSGHRLSLRAALSGVRLFYCNEVATVRHGAISLWHLNDMKSLGNSWLKRLTLCLHVVAQSCHSVEMEWFGHVSHHLVCIMSL
jgi:hypothetical protein